MKKNKFKRSLKDTIIQLDGYSPAEADILIASAQADLDKYLDEENYPAIRDLCRTSFNLGTHYLYELF